ncbi:Nif11-like leader peptide family natural product precursor [Trichothermofontia sp.]
MSKDNVFQFFSQAAKNEQLKDKLQMVTSPEDLVNLGKQEGLDFSSEHVEEAIGELKEQPNFFRSLAAAALAVFTPSHDDYPEVGVQPFSGDPNPHP